MFLDEISAILKFIKLILCQVMCTVIHIFLICYSDIITSWVSNQEIFVTNHDCFFSRVWLISYFGEISRTIFRRITTYLDIWFLYFTLVCYGLRCYCNKMIFHSSGPFDSGVRHDTNNTTTTLKRTYWHIVWRGHNHDILLIDQFHPVIDKPLIVSLLLPLELDGVLAVLREKLTDAHLVVAQELVVVGKAEQLRNVLLILTLHHLQ